MKQTVIILLCALLSALQMAAVRAYPHPKKIQQPDGSTLTIVGHGDEYSHYVTTTDGYTVVKGYDGVYRYAVMSGGKLKASAVKASDKELRSAAEAGFLFSVERNLKPEVSETGKRLMPLSGKTDAPLKHMYRFPAQSEPRPVSILQDYRGLVIMVNFTDRKFLRGEQAREMMDNKMNGADYIFYDDPLLQARVQCTGSVRDYFYDNSNGLFVPEFDVVGPVEVDASQYYIKGAERSYELVCKVLEAADADIDYSRYDSDGDGVVDMIYLVYAGYSSNYQGNDERTVWPHAGHLANFGNAPVLDGMQFGRFACSSEIYGWEADGDKYLDGIGVIVHEFSHVLGFKDHYDVSGYLNEEPATWDVMASGCYNGVFNDTPCGYNSYERYAAGFLQPRTLTRLDDGESVSLRPLSAYNDALRVVSTQDSTVFMVENRQLEKWDKELPGHGMLVWRVDSCDNQYWEHNALNVNGRLHFKLVRAMGATRDLFRNLFDTDYDPFPGTRNIDALTNYTMESDLLTDARYPCPVMFRDIREEDGIITLSIEEDSVAEAKPYTFALKEEYRASGISDESKECLWDVRTEIKEEGNRVKYLIYNLVPDTRNISGTDPKYHDGLAASYALSGDRKQIIIEPFRVALSGENGVWLVNFTDLENGGSGAIVLDMDPYGNISLPDPETQLGYCTMPKNKVIVKEIDIIERFSLVRNIRFNASGSNGIPQIPGMATDGPADIFNLQGIRVSAPRKGEIYITGGKKVKF